MGIQVNAQRDSNTSYVHAIHTVGSIFMQTITKPWLRHRFLFRLTPEGRAFYKSLDILHSFTRRVINERRMEHQTNVKPSQKKQSEVIGAKKKQAFLDLLLEKHHQNPAALTVEDIAEEVDTFMFEGHDTTAVGVSWCLFLLGHDLVWQQRVVDEIIEVVGDDPTTPITKEHLPKLKYLECVIKIHDGESTHFDRAGTKLLRQKDSKLYIACRPVHFY
ncbi:cytochrome P450 4c3-like [Tropilaelaps mercedesae]|uniref:Cytochrome P450 4c3-like n=1 Tax=Tropilaelaps mercedesae TaxID=418985 RepID=A0A1V9XP40_9ACAR|nr:cytochrome P450 4c3-like [Tropilaelaps mercedesae]